MLAPVYVAMVTKSVVAVDDDVVIAVYFSASMLLLCLHKSMRLVSVTDLLILN